MYVHTLLGDRNEALVLDADGYLLDKQGQLAIGPSVRDVTITVHCDVNATILLKKVGSILEPVAKVRITDSKLSNFTLSRLGRRDGDTGRISVWDGKR